MSKFTSFSTYQSYVIQSFDKKPGPLRERKYRAGLKVNTTSNTLQRPPLGSYPSMWIRTFAYARKRWAAKKECLLSFSAYPYQ